MESMKWSSGQIDTLIQDVREHPCLWDCTHQDIDNEKQKSVHFNILINKYQCDFDKVLYAWNQIIITYFLVCQKYESIKDNNDQSTMFLLALVYSFLVNIQVEVQEAANLTNSKSQSEEGTNNKENSIESIVNGKEDGVEKLTKIKSEIVNNQNPQQNMATIELDNQAKNTEEEAYIDKASVLTDTMKECKVFGELIAIKLKYLNSYIRQTVMNDIHNVLHQAILGTHAHNSMQDSVRDATPFIKGYFTVSSPLSPTDTSTSQNTEPSSS